MRTRPELNSMKEKGQIIRQRIVEAANDLFYKQGYDHTSFTDIADAAGIARGNFYYYFKTKDDILAAVIHDRVENIRAMLVSWDADIPDPRNRLKRYVAILTNMQGEISQYGCPVGSLCTELAKLEHIHYSEATEMFAVFRDWLETQIRLLGHDEDAPMLALHLLARGQGVSMVTNAFRDDTFLKREAAAIEEWIDAL